MGNRWDAIIVGGGPAGASLAVLLSRHGVRVVLVDQSQISRQKVCGDFCTSMWPLLDQLGVAGAVERLALPIEMLELVLPGGRRLLAALPGDGNCRGAAALSRWTLDTLLLDEARRAGVEVLLHRHVGKVLIESGRWRSACKLAPHTARAAARNCAGHWSSPRMDGAPPSCVRPAAKIRRRG